MTIETTSLSHHRKEKGDDLKGGRYKEKLENKREAFGLPKYRRILGCVELALCEIREKRAFHRHPSRVT